MQFTCPVCGSTNTFGHGERVHVRMMWPQTYCLGCAYSAGVTQFRPQPDEALTEVKEMNDFKPYRRKQIAELRPYRDGETLAGVSISVPDQTAGSPKIGDMIARNPKNHKDQWLVAAQYFADNFEPVTDA